VVHANKQFYHCFGCGIHGDAIEFLTEYQEMAYQQAVMWLAKRYRFYPKEWARKRRRAKTTQAHVQMKEALRI
jgi:DNA primase